MQNTLFHYNTYLSKCDLINKYNKTDELSLPQLNSIVLDIPLKQLFGLISNSSFSKVFTSKIEFKIYFILYLEYCCKPYINFKIDKKNRKGISLKCKISNKIFIESFLFDFFRGVISNPFFNYYLYINNIVNLNNDKKVNINFKTPLFFIPNLNLITNFFFKNINLKNLYSTIHFHFKNIQDNNNINNLPSFWVIKNLEEE